MKVLAMALRQTFEHEIRVAVFDCLGHHNSEVVNIALKYLIAEYSVALIEKDLEVGKNFKT